MHRGNVSCSQSDNNTGQIFGVGRRSHFAIALSMAALSVRLRRGSFVELIIPRFFLNRRVIQFPMSTWRRRVNESILLGPRNRGPAQVIPLINQLTWLGDVQCCSAAIGDEANNDFVYSCRGFSNTDAVGPASTNAPLFITATLFATRRTRGRSCEMNMYARPRRS